MKSFINKYYFALIFLAILIVVVSSILLGKKEVKGIRKNSKYTIGIITSDWHQKNDNGVGTDFIYFVRNRKISKTGPYNLKKGERCLIMYDSTSPTHYLMLSRYLIPKNIKAPYNGWSFKEIPIKIDSVDLNEYFKIRD